MLEGTSVCILDTTSFFHLIEYVFSILNFEMIVDLQSSHEDSTSSSQLPFSRLPLTLTWYLTMAQ